MYVPLSGPFPIHCCCDLLAQHHSFQPSMTENVTLSLQKIKRQQTFSKHTSRGSSSANSKVITLVLLLSCHSIIELVDSIMLLPWRGLPEKISAIIWFYTEAKCHSRLAKPCWVELKAL